MAQTIWLDKTGRTSNLFPLPSAEDFIPHNPLARKRVAAEPAKVPATKAAPPPTQQETPHVPEVRLEVTVPPPPAPAPASEKPKTAEAAAKTAPVEPVQPEPPKKISPTFITAVSMPEVYDTLYFADKEAIEALKKNDLDHGVEIFGAENEIIKGKAYPSEVIVINARNGKTAQPYAWVNTETSFDAKAGDLKVLTNELKYELAREISLRTRENLIKAGVNVKRAMFLGRKLANATYIPYCRFLAAKQAGDQSRLLTLKDLQQEIEEAKKNPHAKPTRRGNNRGRSDTGSKPQTEKAPSAPKAETAPPAQEKSGSDSSSTEVPTPAREPESLASVISDMTAGGMVKEIAQNLPAKAKAKTKPVEDGNNLGKLAPALANLRDQLPAA